MNEVILQYVEPVYRFCRKRLTSEADAEDLSQEILLCILHGIKQGKISNISGYVWRVAHNRYVRKIQSRKDDPVVLYGHDYFPEIIDANVQNDMMEIHNAVFTSLHTLSAMYRDIMVDYYVRHVDTRTIAKRHGISVESVKWRLHAGREKIRERMTYMEKNYERIKMHIMCNGAFDPAQYLNTQLQKAIAKACYTSPLTLEEISLATGAPTLYLEDTLEHMISGDAVEQIGNKFATNFIITPPASEMDSLLNEAVIGEATSAILEYIKSVESQVRGLGFYGKDFPLSHLLHIIVPAIVYVKSNNNSRQKFPPRKDGGYGWFIVAEGAEELDWRSCGMNGYSYRRFGNTRFNYFWVGDTLSHDLGRLLSGNAEFFLSALGKDFSLMITNEEDEARAIAHGLCKNNDNRIIPCIPIFSEEEYALFLKWAKKCPGLDGLWDKWITSLKTAYKSFTPKRLVDQIDGNINGQSFNLSAYVIKQLQKQGIASVANENDVFTNNLFLVRQAEII
ncbi:MAG: RNA polymerase sigma factor [Defluviitaleaceae bacterium]|nr:RNA polymerase sigma factor [Defluviitaleaceae bacterium]